MNLEKVSSHYPEGHGRPYRAPQLLVYGDVRELTTAKASSNFGGDNPMFPRLKT